MSEYFTVSSRVRLLIKAAAMTHTKSKMTQETILRMRLLFFKGMPPVYEMVFLSVFGKFHNAHVGEIAVLFVKIQAVAHDEFIGNDESRIIQRNLRDVA